MQSPALSLLAAFILAFGIRLLLLLRYYCINNDGVIYVEIARWLWEGDWGQAFAAYFPPMYPLLIAVVYPLVGDWEVAGQFWPLVLGLLTIFPLYAMLKRIYNHRVASVAILFFALSPYLVRFSLHVRNESPYIFFLVLALYFFQRGMERGSLWFFFTGVSASFAYLMRPEGIGMVMVGCVYLFYRVALKGGAARGLKQALVLVTGFFLFASPYILFLKSDTGQWAISRKGAVNVAWGMAEYDKSGLITKDSGELGALRLITSNPSLYAKKVFIDLVRSPGVYLEALHYSYLPFLAVGWVLFFRSRFWDREDFFLACLVLFYLVVFALLQVNRRFAAPLIPVSLGWVAVGFLTIKDYCYKRWEKNGPMAVGLVILVFLLGTLPKGLQPIGLDKVYLRDAGIYLRDKAMGAKVFTTEGRVSFYANMPYLLVVKEPRKIPNLLKEAQADYLAVDGVTFKDIEASYKDRGWIIDKEFPGEKGEKLLVLRRVRAGQ